MLKVRGIRDQVIHVFDHKGAAELQFSNVTNKSEYPEYVLKVLNVSKHDVLMCFSRENVRGVCMTEPYCMLIPICAEYDGGKGQGGIGTGSCCQRGGETELSVRESSSAEHQRPEPRTATGDLSANSTNSPTSIFILYSLHWLFHNSNPVKADKD